MRMISEGVRTRICESDASISVDILLSGTDSFEGSSTVASIVGGSRSEFPSQLPPSKPTASAEFGGWTIEVGVDWSSSSSPSPLLPASSESETETLTAL